MKKMASSCTAFLLLALGAGAVAFAQQQPVEQRQQTKQDQRQFFQHVYRHDQETILEDPAITNQLSNEQIRPDSNEQNVESRELSLDDLRHPRFVPAPAAGEGMQFVPGKGYVAGRTEQATEPGMSALAPTLGFQMTGGLNSGENPTSGTQFSTMTPNENSAASRRGVNPYAEAPDPLLSLDLSQAGMQTMGIDSALEHRPPLTLVVPEPLPWQNTLTRPSDLTAGRLPADAAPFRRSDALAPSACEFKIDPATIHDGVELKRLSREGCLNNGKTDYGRD